MSDKPVRSGANPHRQSMSQTASKDAPNRSKRPSHDLSEESLRSDTAATKSSSMDERTRRFTEATFNSDSSDAARPFDPLLYSVNDAARRLGVSVSTVWRLLAEKKLYPTYVRGRTMISEAELQRYVAESTVRQRVKETPIAGATRKARAQNRVHESAQDDELNE
jgi:excisionase family DNA binding protein